MKKATKLICTLALTAAVTGTSGLVMAFAEADKSYYVCYSTENYAVRNANKMKEEDGEFYLKNVSLNSLVNFYVTDASGRRWYDSKGKEMSVSDAADYDIKFSPDNIYSEDGKWDEGEWEKTDCNITYTAFVPAEYSVLIGGGEVALNYNPYLNSFDEYYLSSIEIKGGTEVSYGDEKHAVEHDGYYRIKFTPDKDYAYDENGNAGKDESKYIYKLHVEDAPQYYLLPEGESFDNAILLTRYEKNTAASEYRSGEFFINGRDRSYRYNVYEKYANGEFSEAIDDDNDEDTDVSKIKIADAGWYQFSFIDLNDKFASSCAYYSKYDFGGFYAAGEFNGYCYGPNGEKELDDKFEFKMLEDGDDDYDKDYDQYVLYLTVSEKSLKDGDVEFYITDGDKIYKNGTEYIKISRAGEYKILFSDEHFYGNGRRYRYVLLDEETDYTELEIGTAEEFVEFAKNCSASAEYSKNLAVYLTADIDFAKTDFVSVGEFSGKFYGGYHTLKNVKLSKENPSIIKLLKRDGLFERVTVQDVTLADKDADYAGVIGKNYGTVASVTVYGSITGNNYVGAVAGYNGRSAENETTGSTDTNTLYRYGVIKNCKNYAEVSGTVHSGGICGFNSGEIISCENFASISYRKQTSSSTPFNLGGIAGYSAGKITACTNNGGIVGGSETLYAGGVCGLCTGEIYYSFNNASVSGGKYVGGITGYYGTLQDKDDADNFFGGLSYEQIYDKYFGNDQNDFEQVSGNKQIIKYCANYGGVTSVSFAGGIAGYTDVATLAISCCVSEADITVTAGSYAGGIIGRSTGAKIESCVAGGTVSAKGLNEGKYVGGIAGYGNNITVCSSVCELIGSDYIGGIAGYNVSNISACWANVIIIPSSGAEFVGNIAGFTEANKEDADKFSAGFENNFYIENASDNYGGVCGRSYGKSYAYAATPVDSDELAYKGVVSPNLSEGFNSEAKWQGTADKAYPVPRYLMEADECDEFDDEAEFAKLFGVYGGKLSETAIKNARVLYSVSFLEWNEDNGSLYDDGELQIDNFDPILTVRLPLGAAVSIPEFKWAQCVDGRYIYEGSDASYFVTFPEIGVVSGNQVIRAQYREIATTISTDDDKILVEGEFDVDTKVELVSSVNGYSLRFTLNGEEIDAGEVLVKFRPDDADGSRIELYSADGTKTQIKEFSGNYLVFTYSDGDYFTLIVSDKKAGLPSWAWAIIGGVIGAVIVAAAFASPVIVSKVKRKKAAEAEEAEETAAAETEEESDKNE